MERMCLELGTSPVVEPVVGGCQNPVKGREARGVEICRYVRIQSIGGIDLHFNVYIIGQFTEIFSRWDGYEGLKAVP